MTNYLSPLNEIYAWGQTPAGAFFIKILPAVLVGIVTRLLSWELFGAIDIFLKEKYSKAFKRLALFFGFSSNIVASVVLALLFANGDSRNVLIAWGVVYGSISVVLQVIWEFILWKIVKAKLKKKYNVNLDKGI